MTVSSDPGMVLDHWRPLWQLFIARLREFYREPEVIFWVYGFPVLLAVGLGIAFWGREPEPPPVDIQEVSGLSTLSASLLEQLRADHLPAEVHDAEECRQRYRTGRTALYITPQPDGFIYTYDPTRQESVLARYRVGDVVQRWQAGVKLAASPGTAAGSLAGESVRRWQAGSRTWETVDAPTREPGNRYIDFLLPGLMGMNLMGGGLWGVGFVIVDMRVRKLLKRLLATPMRRGDFLLSILSARLVFMLPEMLLLVLVGRLGFGVPIVGSIGALALVILVGALAFSGIGLLVASRTGKTETVSGLMNLVMLPMWLFSGIFFSSKRFPNVIQPFIQALPLTQLNDALREVMLEGASLVQVGGRVAILAGWAIVCFFLSLRWFRWQ
jgi:ABC-2 type transport system permease protein